VGEEVQEIEEKARTTGMAMRWGIWTVVVWSCVLVVVVEGSEK